MEGRDSRNGVQAASSRFFLHVPTNQTPTPRQPLLGSLLVSRAEVPSPPQTRLLRTAGAQAGVPCRKRQQLATPTGPRAHPARAQAGTPLLGGRNRAPGPSHRKPPPPGARPAPPPAPHAARRPRPPRAARSPPSPQRPRHLPAAATPAAPNSAPLPPSSARTRAGSRECARSPDPEEAGLGAQVRTT